MSVTTQTARLKLLAYQTYARPAMRLQAAPLERRWMDESSGGFAYRCLPLLIANQSGWLVLNSQRVELMWDGGDAVSSIAIAHPGGSPPFPASSHFGHGIVTWIMPFLFRTPPGYNLLVRGPANLPKDGVSPLEGIVETDWAVSSFTMNWQLTRPGVTVTFDVDEPICMIVPQRRGEIESFDPEIRPIADEPELAARAYRWIDSRRRFIEALSAPGSTETWQKHYFQGVTPDGVSGEGHQTKLSVREFRQPTPRVAAPTELSHRSGDQKEEEHAV
jgi:Family of unknown function (DUF6065)